MATIVPAILESDKAAFEEKASLITKISGVTRIQVDFADNTLVPNELLPISEITSLNPAFHWEAHLMISEPTDFLDYHISGFKSIIIHYEAFADKSNLVTAIREIKSLKMEAGVVIKNDTLITVLEPLAAETNYFQLMTIVPGFQGTPFLDNSYDRIKELRKMVPGAIIETDGGTTLENVQKIAQAGADLIIGGSAIAKSQNPAEAFELLTQKANSRVE